MSFTVIAVYVSADLIYQNTG